jgi:RsiW-degrading membrane proteinase PrsW (M82 family)
MAAQGAIVVAVLIVLTVLLWRRFTRTDRAEGRTRKLLVAYGVFTPLLSLALAVVAVANTTTTAHPLPGLEGLFAGGW